MCQQFTVLKILLQIKFTLVVLQIYIFVCLNIEHFCVIINTQIVTYKQIGIGLEKLILTILFFANVLKKY